MSEEWNNCASHISPAALLVVGSLEVGTGSCHHSVPTPRSGSWLSTQHLGQIQVCSPGSGQGPVPFCCNKTGIAGEVTPGRGIQLAHTLRTRRTSELYSRTPSPSPVLRLPVCHLRQLLHHTLVLAGSIRKWQITAQHLLSAPLHLCRHGILWKQEEPETADNSISDKPDGNWPKD